MKCNCCDKDMSDKETTYNEELGTFELCTVCLDVALDAAYSNGFSRGDDDKYVILGDADDWVTEGITESRKDWATVESYWGFD